MPSRYVPGQIVETEQLSTPELARYVIQELSQLSTILTQVGEGRFDVWGRAPVKPREGQIVYADGTGWNPGSGEGLYFYSNGSWIYIPPGYTAPANWTPVVSFAVPGTSSFGVPTVAVGDITTIGREVVASFRYSSTVTVGTGSGNLQVTGLPIAAVNDANFIWDGVMGAINGVTFPAGRTQVACSLVAGSSTIIFSANGSAVAPTNLQAVDVTGGTITLRGNIRYRWA